MTPLGVTAQIAKQNHVNVKIPLVKHNGIASEYSKQFELKGKVYKLMIQIDKIRAKPGPKCKKPALLASSRREKMEKLREILDERSGNRPQEDVKLINNSHRGEIRPQCSEKKSNNRNKCPVCQEHLDSLLALFTHHQLKHFVCQLCDAPFVSQVACDKHEVLHQGDDALLIYKCHLCEESYDCSKNLKIHVKGSHWETVDVGWNADSDEVKEVIDRLVYECGICSINVKGDENYRNHMVLHQMNVANSLLQPPEKISDMHLSDQRNFKLTCTICTQTFNTADAAETHICSSSTPEELSKICSICKKQFDNTQVLNQHLASHFSGTHNCTVCKKIFANHSSLLSHVKTHTNHNSSVVTVIV
ncbi:zinc finger protein 423-like [Diachasmimorpha longicaudata]|uniref:zinc finger protein 423-like n=1 Tax=Diachasmimorpha longicaudata TaxID=58733 RepID=UPI0030B87B8F